MWMTAWGRKRIFGSTGAAYQISVGSELTARQCGMRIVMAAAALIWSAYGAVAQVNLQAPRENQPGQYRVVLPRPALPMGSVELPRSVAARKWSAPFCVRWTDGCEQCKGSALEPSIWCSDTNDAGCSRTAVRCLDTDDVIAPLFCDQIVEPCGFAAWHLDDQGLKHGASGSACYTQGRERKALDWTCDVDKTERRKRVAPLTRVTRERMRLLIRQSEALGR